VEGTIYTSKFNSPWWVISFFSPSKREREREREDLGFLGFRVNEGN